VLGRRGEDARPALPSCPHPPAPTARRVLRTPVCSTGTGQSQHSRASARVHQRSASDLSLLRRVAGHPVG